MEAIKKAVEVGLGAAFVSRAAVHNEVQLGRLAVLHIEVSPPPPLLPALGTGTHPAHFRRFRALLACLGTLSPGTEMNPVAAGLEAVCGGRRGCRCRGS